MGVNSGVRNITQPRNQNGGQSSLTYPAQAKAGKRDAKLDSGQKFVKPLLDLADSARANAALLNQLLDPRITNADHGEFRGNEKGVRCHKENHQDDP